MKARLTLYCYACKREIPVKLKVIDTAEMPETLFNIQRDILSHREKCKYYKVKR